MEKLGIGLSFSNYITTDYTDQQTQNVLKHIVSSFAEDRKGNLWLKTGNGLVRFDGTNFIRFNIQYDSPSDFFMRPIIKDSWDNLWFGSFISGARFFNAQHFNPITNLNPLKDTSLQYNISVGAIFEDSKKHLWFGTKGEGLVRYDPPTDTKNGSLIYYSSPGNNLQGKWVSHIWGRLSRKSLVYGKQQTRSF